MQIDNIVPTIPEEVDFIKMVDGNTLCIQNEYGYRLKLNSFTADFLSTIDGKRNIRNLAELYNQKVNEKLTIDEYFNLLNGILCKTGIVKLQENFYVQKKKAKYLRLKFCILPYSVSKYITMYLKNIFKFNFFWFLFVVISIIVYFIFFCYVKNMYYNLSCLDLIDMGIVSFLVGLGVVFHEIGHASACHCYGARHGDIGFGFYLLSPVLYSDVSDVWRLPVRQRVIVNLAGILMGNIVALFYFLLYLITQNLIFFYAFYVECAGGLMDLNPLIKYDGYWLLSDTMNFTNMSCQARKQLKEFSLIQIKNYSKRQWFLILYGVSSPIFIGLFLFSVIFLSPDSLLSFPKDFYMFICEIIVDYSKFNLFALVNFTPQFIFYFLLVRLLTGIAVKLVSK